MAPLRNCVVIACFCVVFSGCVALSGTEWDSTVDIDTEGSDSEEQQAAPEFVRECGRILEEMKPVEFLDMLVEKASGVEENARAAALVVETHEQTREERLLGKPMEYIKKEHIPELLERLDSARPALGVALEEAKHMPRLSTESRQAAYLIKGYKKQKYPVTESSEWFHYDPDSLRAWWELYRNDVVSCSRTEDLPDIFSDTELKRTAELDIMERLMWIQLEGVYPDRTIDDYYYFVQIDGEDPDPELLERFSEHKPQVKAVSKLEEIEYDEANLKNGHTVPGTIIGIREVEWITPGCVEVYCETYSGPLRASGGTYRLRLEQGKWVIIDAYDIWLS